MGQMKMMRGKKGFFRSFISQEFYVSPTKNTNLEFKGDFQVLVVLAKIKRVHKN
jgi:hypothetical protein